MWNWLKKLFERSPKPHVHYWRASCWNKFGKPSERTCRCGKRQHLLTFKELWDSTWYDFSSPLGGDKVKWRDGPHPTAERMRRDGVTQND